MTRILADWLRDPRVQSVFAMLSDAGYAAYFVGGCVRNALLDMAVSDLDLATSALPQDVVRLAERAGIKALPTGIEHGTVTLVVDGRAFEVTTFRRDVATDGRRAVVAFSDKIEEDARRRDFTMNALYATPEGAVLDPTGKGLSDLKARRVRFVGSADIRIKEDYLRILRFFRFHAWFGDPQAGPDAEALAAIESNLAGLETLSRERVGHEMLKMLAAENPAPAMVSAAQAGVLARILPGANPGSLAPLVKLEQQTGVQPDALRRLAAMGRLADVKERLRLSRKDAKRVAVLVEGVESAAGVAELAWRFGAAHARDVALLRAAVSGSGLAPGLEREIAAGASAKFPIKASDLVPLSGPALGARLKELEARWVGSGFTLTREELLK